MPSATIRMMLWALCFRVMHALVHLSVLCIPKFVNFTKFTTLVLLGTKMNLSDFEVKGQGHGETKCGQKSTFGGVLSP